MGRWGSRLFEGDQDLDIACNLNDFVRPKGEKWEHNLSHMIHQTDMLAPQEARRYYKTQEYAERLENEIVPWVRAKLDTDNLGDKIFAASRAKESEEKDHFDPGKYKTILLGALMMRAGAKIKEEDLQHLRDLVPQINCNSGYALSFCDQGFRSPGRAQFLAALDHYQPGVPRNFQEPSCFRCGQVQGDIGHALAKCARCKGAWYCDKTCQHLHWQEHEPSCISPKYRVSLNV